MGLFRKQPTTPECPLPESAFGGPHAEQRRRMIVEHLWKRGVHDREVLEAMARVPREAFIDTGLANAAYDDSPLRIGHDQTISQPYIVARMTELSGAGPARRILEIGAGSGYQTAILLEMGAHVWAIEIIQELAGRAEKTLTKLGYENFTILCRDGFGGLPQKAPFDAILLAAAPESPPPALFDQLAVGGRLIAPIGPREHQHLYVFTRTRTGIRREKQFSVRFVPMTGQAEPGND